MEPPKRVMLLPPPPVVKKETKTYCFELKLGESNDETYPEFSWKDLVRDAQRTETASKTEKGGTSLDPYASDDEDDLKAMAARFEEKYNKSDTGKLGKRKRRAEDYIDRGAGYDLEDPFIDNNDIYDEVVPEDMEPVHGGFYINSGSLDYKEVEVSDCDDEEPEKSKKSKQPDAAKLSKPNKKQLPPAGIVKRRRSSTNGIASNKIEKTETKTDKSAANKVGAKNQKENSRSTSPATAIPKKKTSMVIISSSDSSSSSSEDSSSTDSSGSDSGSESKKEINLAATKPKLQLQTCTTFREIVDPKPKPRLKLKNVPLNPKLHGDKGAEEPKPVITKATISPMSNRDIFGASQSMTNISSINIPSGLSATSLTLSATNLSRLSTSTVGLRTSPPFKHNTNVKPRKANSGTPSGTGTALKQAALAAMTLGEPQMKKQRKPKVGSGSGPTIRQQQQGIKLNAKHGSVISPGGKQQQNFISESAGVMPALTPYPSTSMTVLSESTKSKNNRKTNSPAALSVSAHQNFGQLGSSITVTEVHDKISRPPTLTPAPQLLFNSSMASNNNRTTTPPTFTLSGGSPNGISLPASITITTPGVGRGKSGENHRTNPLSRQAMVSTSISTPSTLSSTHGKLLKPQHFTPFDVNALLAHSSSGGLKSNTSEKKIPLMGQLPYQQQQREGYKK